MEPTEFREIRFRLELSQRELARHLGLDRNGWRYVQRIEKGDLYPSGPIMMLMRYFDKHGVDEDLTINEIVETG